MAVDIQEYARVLAEAVLNGDPTWSVASVEKALGDDRRGTALRRAVRPATGGPVVFKRGTAPVATA